MSSIKATNPRIIWIARGFNKKYPGVNLGKKIEAADSGNERAVNFLMTKPILVRNAERFLDIGNLKQAKVYKKYLHAIAQAQIHLSREDNEYEYLKELVNMNFAPSRHKDIFSVISNITGELSHTVNTATEINFLNYLIDNLADVSLVKTSGVKFFVGDIDSELTSNKNGFILTGIQAEAIKNLFVEAASIPLHDDENCNFLKTLTFDNQCTPTEKIRFLNPSDPVIASIAHMFNTEHSHTSLLNELKLAENGDDNANNRLRNEPLLIDGINKIPEKYHEGNTNAILEYFYAIAYAQRRIQRKGNEIKELRSLTMNNYPKERWSEILGGFSDIAKKLRNKEPEYEKNFFNYLIDKLIFIAQEKKNEFEMREMTDGDTSKEDNRIEIGDIVFEVRSGENGFIADISTTNRIYDLLSEAALWTIHKER